jgi:predicted HNH restriction endonuclease
MATISERDLIIPTLTAIVENDGKIYTSNLIIILRKKLKPKGKDLRILANRSDDHFSQKVRNLISHRTLKNYANYTAGKNRDGLLVITASGRNYIKSQKTSFIKLNKTENDFSNEHVEILEGGTTVRKIISRKRSQKIRKEALIRHGTSCKACEMSFFDRYIGLKIECIELHHINPISKGVRSSSINDLVPLCPNCHRVAHTTIPPMPLKTLRSKITKRM